jgi:hypothetical protein
MPSAQDFAERLREQAYRTLLPQVRDLEQELKGVSSSLLAGFEQIERKLESFSKIELPTTGSILTEILDTVVRQKDMETNALVLFMRGLQQKETQEEILSFLLDGIHQFYPQVALFAVRGGRFNGWSSRGFTETLARTISTCSFPCSEYPQFEAALEGEAQTAAPDFAEDSPLQFLREHRAELWSLLPLRAMRRPVALLLTGGTDNRPDAAVVMAGLAALRLENVALKILHDLSATQPRTATLPTIEESAPDGAMANPEPLPAVAAEKPVLIQTPPEETHPETASVFDPEPARESVFDADAVTTRASTETQTMPMEGQAVEISPVPLPEGMITQTPEAKPVPEEEKRHTDAKRFARLLVQEIKLYNEHHVKEGRLNCDLYLRLKREIDRSREMYEGRISPLVSQKIDYFHDEIIRILGDNDPSTLGSDYPGPRVES